jgi:hypothetical protein
VRGVGIARLPYTASSMSSSHITTSHMLRYTTHCYNVREENELVVRLVVGFEAPSSELGRRPPIPHALFSQNVIPHFAGHAVALWVCVQ